MSGPGLHHFQQQWAPLQPPQPSISTPSAITVEFPVRPTSEEVRTIFIAGFPADVKERELHNLLRWLPGFEASQINMKGDQPMGFALFSTAQHAVAAKTALQDLVFDSATNSTLHIEMAKKNLFVKRGMGADFSSLDQSKRIRTGGEYAQSGYPSPPFPPQTPSLWTTSGYMAPPVLYAPYGGYPVTQVALPTPVSVPAPTVYAPVQNTKDNPPCNTLFVGNLGENVTEEELRGLFSAQPGYKQMKILRHDRSTVCFIEFDDVASATGVHIKLQGAVLPSAGHTGIRIQFSKNPFGRRKDLNGTPAETKGST
ncbi:RNA-binding protein with multiple splicing [Phalaenopsis equestris]|uniref:RNA-binding protein with multiple splicing n=1 Tax=Phalaenopsis equestris TaxID=78828 RepID=UPI0009E64B25|nr:RNA-binding protein with multiple splicing [Phalaenopsis equestris]XP_020599027.1 RNA-binding protein with multiple splicing [Phalaenopsis equestris]